jgi:hypothetical protein
MKPHKLVFDAPIVNVIHAPEIVWATHIVTASQERIQTSPELPQ